MNTAHFPAQP